MKPQSRVTIRDVAAAAGVSAMTVSNVINRRHSFVSERTRAIVLREIERLNYRVNVHGKNLRNRDARSLGFVHLASELSEAASDVVALLAALFRLRASPAFEMSVATVYESQLDDEALAPGAVADIHVVYPQLMAARAMQSLPLLLSRLSPVIVVGARKFSALAERQSAAIVPFDRADGAALLVDHLALRRARRLTYVSKLQDWRRETRLAALRAAVRRIRRPGTAFFEAVLARPGELTFPIVEALFARGADRPDAIVVDAEAMALDVIAAAEMHGLRVPGDVKVASFEVADPTDGWLTGLWQDSDAVALVIDRTASQIEAGQSGDGEADTTGSITLRIGRSTA